MIIKGERLFHSLNAAFFLIGALYLLSELKSGLLNAAAVGLCIAGFLYAFSQATKSTINKT
jgi:hypothetical protein